MSQKNVKVQSSNTKKNVLIDGYWKWVILGALLIFFYFHASQYIEKDVWHDEAFQILYSQKDWSYIMGTNDVHPPIFNMIAKIMVWVTPDILSLRFKMLLIGLGFVTIFYLMVGHIFNNDVAFYSTALLVMSPTYAYYSVEFRSYMFVLMLMVAQIYYFWVFYKEKEFNYNYFLLFSVTSLICLWTHYYSILILFSELCFLFFYDRDKFIHHFEEYCFLFALPFLLVIPYIISQMGKIHSFWFKETHFINLISTFFYLISFPTLEFSLFQLVVMILVLLGIVYGIIGKDERIIFFISLLLIPIISVFLFSKIFPFYHHRYFLFGGIGIFIFAGYFIYNLDLKLKKDLGLLILGFVVIVFFINLPLFTDALDIDLRDSSDFMKEYMVDKEDYVFIHESTFSQSPYKVYIPDKKHYLLKNISREELFTAGGSVVGDDEKINNLSIISGNYFYLTNTTRLKQKLIYSKGGLYIYEIEK